MVGKGKTMVGKETAEPAEDGERTSRPATQPCWPEVRQSSRDQAERQRRQQSGMSLPVLQVWRACTCLREIPDKHRAAVMRNVW
jgi:hypothetical protein